MILRILVNRKYRLPRDKTSLSANATGVFFFFFFFFFDSLRPSQQFSVILRWVFLG